MQAEIWQGRGAILVPDATEPQIAGHVMLPTPRLARDGSLEIVFGATDGRNRGRVFTMAVDPADPRRVLRRPRVALLEPGPPGSFDERGVVPTCWLGGVELDDSLLFYSGFGQGEDSPYVIMCGVAPRHGEGRILTAQSEGAALCCGAFVLRTADGGYRMWLLFGTGWTRDAAGKKVPTYDIRTTTSCDPRRWDAPLEPCLQRNAARGEIGFSRPWVCVENGRFRMWFSVRRLTEGGEAVYDAMGYAESDDGRTFRRDDARVHLSPSATGGDAAMRCYPAVIEAGGRSLMLYCGDGNGRGGLFFAERARR